jgi:hypothetical protein
VDVLSNVLLHALWFALPFLTMGALLGGLIWFIDGTTPRILRPLAGPASRLLAGLRPARTAPAIPEVFLVLELRRLGKELQRIEEGEQPHRAARIAAAQAAYDQVLMELCRRAGVATPSGLPPLSPHVRLDLETELVASGVDW